MDERDQRKDLERSGTEGDTPVRESRACLAGSLSTSGHVQSGGNLGGPPSKAKYYLLTDSERVP